MSKKVNEELLALDKRILSRKVSHGEVSEKDLQSFLKTLPDVAENGDCAWPRAGLLPCVAPAATVLAAAARPHVKPEKHRLCGRPAIGGAWRSQAQARLHNLGAGARPRDRGQKGRPIRDMDMLKEPAPHQLR